MWLQNRPEFFSSRELPLRTDPVGCSCDPSIQQPPMLSHAAKLLYRFLPWALNWAQLSCQWLWIHQQKSVFSRIQSQIARISWAESFTYGWVWKSVSVHVNAQWAKQAVGFDPSEFTFLLKCLLIWLVWYFYSHSFPNVDGPIVLQSTVWMRLLRLNKDRKKSNLLPCNLWASHLIWHMIFFFSSQDSFFLAKKLTMYVSSQE